MGYGWGVKKLMITLAKNFIKIFRKKDKGHGPTTRYPMW